MRIDEWKAVVLHKMGLTRPMTADEICRCHNGIQAQFPSYAEDGFRFRLSDREWASDWRRDLVRQWSLRGTVHAYLKEEISLYHYRGRHQNQWHDYVSKYGDISRDEEQRYARLILDSLRSGNKTRDELKSICRAAGLSSGAEKQLFNAWGGILAAMVCDGLIYQEYERRAFGLLDDYQPWEGEAARLEIARRYFSGFGPMSLSDARYYFKETKATVEGWVKQLDLRSVDVEGTIRYYHGPLPSAADIPEALFVAGFDSLLLAIEKRANPFFDPNFIRAIYTMTGIVRPTVLLRGTVVATWRREKGKLLVNPFRPLRAKDRKRIESAAFLRFPNPQIHWE